jgi:hypothetical protein
MTALEGGVWLRIYEEGGARLFERELTRGETVTVPPTATDPRINTGRPDALAITIGGQSVAKLSDRPTTISGVPVSAAALLARAVPSAETGVAPRAGGFAAPVRRPTARRAPATGQTGIVQPTGESTSAPAAPASPPAPSRGAGTQTGRE